MHSKVNAPTRFNPFAEKLMSLDFNNKVVVVTGAGNGLGKSHALLFGSLGAKVVVNDLGGSGSGEGSDATVADKVVAEIKDSGGDAVANPDSSVTSTLAAGPTMARSSSSLVIGTTTCVRSLISSLKSGCISGRS